MATVGHDSSLAHENTENYDIFAHEARLIIDQLVHESLTHVQNSVEILENNVASTGVERGHFVELENAPKTKGLSSVSWPTIANFTNEKIGLEKINEYIDKEWKTAPGGHDECWLYAIDFVELKSLEFNDLYIYRVRYSIPTRRHPIPKQTVSAYFTIDVSKVKPKTTPVKVSFVFETMRIIYHPEDFRFRQNLLNNIVSLKEKMANSFDF